MTPQQQRRLLLAVARVLAHMLRSMLDKKSREHIGPQAALELLESAARDAGETL